MSVIAVERTDQWVKNLGSPNIGGELRAVGGVASLYLQIQATGAKSWIYRIVVGGKRIKMDLGNYPTVSFKEARDEARTIEKQVSQGTDPIAKRKLFKRH